MTKRLADVLTDNMVSRGVLPCEKRSVLSYGLETLFSSIFGLWLIIGVSIISGAHFAWAFFMLTFVPLRRTAGGYHANTHAGCYFVLTTVFTLCTAMEGSAVLPEIAYVVADATAALIVFLLSPCVPLNKPLKDQQKRKNHYLSIVFSVLFLVLGILLFRLGVEHRYIHFCHFGILSAAVSLVAAKIKIHIKGDKKNEKET